MIIDLLRLQTHVGKRGRVHYWPIRFDHLAGESPVIECKSDFLHFRPHLYTKRVGQPY